MTRYAAVAIAVLHVAAVHAAEVPLVPLPKKVQWTPGAFTLTKATPVVIDANDDAAALAAPALVERLERSTGLSLAIVSGGARDGAIVLQREEGMPEEAYRVDVTPHRTTLRASSAAGYAHAATTLWQLAGTKHAARVAIPAAHVEDAPRLRWRGLLLDSARHFQSPEFILRFIDTMAAQKLNVLHWHLTDDQGWRIEIRKYPRLTSVGAWRVPAGAGRTDIDRATGKARLYGGYYTQQQARLVVAYAAARGVTIVPEIEMPGHASAILAAYPQFATASAAPTEVPSDWGVYSNVLNLEEPTLAFLEDVLTEVMSIFPGPYIHIGGDEVQTAQWKASPRIQERMRELGIADVKDIQHWLTRRMALFVAKQGRRIVGWDEMLEPDLPAGAIVMSWRGAEGAIAAAAQAHDSVMAVDPELYFDHRQGTSLEEPPGRVSVVSLETVYRFDPVPASLGLQGNLWSEHIRTEARMGWMAFPRAAAIAEVGWTDPARRDWNDFHRRMAAMPARYEALGMTYAKTAFRTAPAMAAGSSRESRELELCTQGVALSLEDDAPLEGPRTQFLVDILNPCWIFRAAKLDGVRAIEARVGQVPFNFQVGEAAAKIGFETPRTAEGELVVHADTCEGEVIARLPLARAAASNGVTSLSLATLEPRTGVHDLCLRFAQRGLDPMWVIDRVQLVGGAR